MPLGHAPRLEKEPDTMDENDLLDNLIDLCDDLAWGRPASEDRLFGLTAPQASFQILGQTPCQTPGQAS